jgi:hypothetical protein
MATIWLNIQDIIRINLSIVNRMRRRTSKRVYQCVRQTRKKYTIRSSPPYPAMECPGKKKKGNDGKTYRSTTVGDTGIYRWVLVK